MTVSGGEQPVALDSMGHDPAEPIGHEVHERRDETSWLDLQDRTDRAGKALAKQSLAAAGRRFKSRASRSISTLHGSVAQMAL
jgi:hypothetical protein